MLETRLSELQRRRDHRARCGELGLIEPTARRVAEVAARLNELDEQFEQPGLGGGSLLGQLPEDDAAAPGQALVLRRAVD